MCRIPGENCPNALMALVADRPSSTASSAPTLHDQPDRAGLCLARRWTAIPSLSATAEHSLFLLDYQSAPSRRPARHQHRLAIFGVRRSEVRAANSEEFHRWKRTKSRRRAE